MSEVIDTKDAIITKTAAGTIKFYLRSREMSAEKAKDVADAINKLVGDGATTEDKPKKAKKAAA